MSKLVLPESVYLEGPEGRRDAAVALEALKKRLEETGIDMHDSRPGQHNNLLCPRVDTFLVYFVSLCLYMSL